MRESALAWVRAKEAWRSRWVRAVAFGLVLAGGGLASSGSGDGSAVGRLRTFLSWLSEFDALVLSLTAVFVGTAFAADLRSGRLSQVVTGPARRGGVFLAWWAGSALVIAGLAVFSQAVLFGLTHWQLAQAPEEVRPALERALQARGVAHPEPVDRDMLRGLAERAVQELRQAGRIPPGRTVDEVLEERQGVYLRRLLTASRGEVVRWQLEGIRPAEGAETFSLRFRYSVQTAEGGTVPAGAGPRGNFGFRPEGNDLVTYAPPGTWAPREVHEVIYPLEVLEGAESVEVVYFNDDPRPLWVSFGEVELALLYPRGGFLGNVVAAALVLLARLVFLSAVATSAAAWLDGKLAALVALFVWALGSAHGFLWSALTLEDYASTIGPLAPLLKGVLWILPDLYRLDLARLLSAGEAVGWDRAVHTLLVDGVLRSAVVLLLGAWLLSKRELGDR